jgi:uncharacterized iron-regulated protein
MNGLHLFKNILLLVALGLALPALSTAHPHILDVDKKVEISTETLLDDLKSVQVVFVGELHDHVGHHRAQLAIIDALDDNPEQPLAIGLEMFRRDSQEDLDVWTANKMPLLQFLEIYNDNWSMWPEYSDIFLHARNEEVKMLGLNIPRQLTSKVAKSGFKSLSSNERLLLGNVQCEVDSTYGKYIRQAMGGYGGHGEQYLFFCEAQLLWDTVMARNLIDFLKDNPDYRVVVLAGSGHSWKFGIPRQLAEQADISYRVILPEMPDRVDRSRFSDDVADYLWLDEGREGWTF